MRKWLWIVLGAFLALVVGVAAAAFLLVDAEAIRALVVRRAQAELGREVALGTLELDLFPTPALLARELRVAGDAADAPLLAANEVRLRLALRPLLSGNVALHAVELRGVAVTLPVGPDGLPALPQLGSEGGSPDASTRSAPPADPAPSPGAGADPEADADAEGADGVRLSIDRLALEDVSLRSGPWQIENLSLTGELDLEGTSELAFRADLPGLGAVRDGTVTLRELSSAAPTIAASVTLQTLELGELARRLDALPAGAKVYAEATGPVAAVIRGGVVESGRAELALSQVAAQIDTTRVDGAARVLAELGGSLEVDLTQAVVAVEGSLHKPAGDRLALTGELGTTPGPAMLQKAVLMLGPNELPLTLDAARRRVSVGQSTLALAPLSPWVLPTAGAPPATPAVDGTEAPPVKSVAGTVDIARLDVALTPLALDGQLALRDVIVELARGPLSVDGEVTLAGQKVTAPLVLGLAGQTSRVRTVYDLASGILDVGLEASDVAVDPVLSALMGDSDITGILAANLEVRGKPELAALTGGGEITLSPGAIRGFSLMREVLGRVAPIVEQVARARGKDLSRYDQEGFERLNAQVSLRGGELRLEPALVEYRDARAELRGTVNLVDQRLALSGTLTLSPALTSDLVGTETERSLAIAIPRIGGTLATPRVELDAGAVAQSVGKLALQVGLSRGLEDKLRERLGDEGGSAIQGILEGLGGRRRSEDAP